MPKRSRSKAWLIVVLLVLLAAIGSVSYLGWRQSVRGVVSVTTPPRFVGHKTAFVFTLEAARGNVARVEIRIVQGGSSSVVAKQEGTFGQRVEVPFVLESAALGLREGSASVEVWARDDFWRPLRPHERAIASYPVTVDLTPPKIELLGATRYLSQGGSGLVAFRVTGASRTTVSAGKLVEPSFAWGPPERGTRVALIALPWDLPPGTALTITAEDEAGNVASRGIPSELRPRRFPRDSIELKDAFLEAKVPELLPQRQPSQPLVDSFLIINRDLRRQAEETKRRIGATTADQPLWEGPLVPPRKTKVFANFAETRTYRYAGRDIDTQVHYGYDLASTKQSPVTAANRGVVAFADPLTIYGNTVILDHGLGLQTLYAHLSSMEVKVGDEVAKGQELGRTGASGLALGDHLHFEVLVHGVSVTPIEWWDAGLGARAWRSPPLRGAGPWGVGDADRVVGREVDPRPHHEAAPRRGAVRDRQPRGAGRARARAERPAPHPLGARRSHHGSSGGLFERRLCRRNRILGRPRRGPSRPPSINY